MKEFTFEIFREILISFISSGYKIVTFNEFILSSDKDNKSLILRHDVDRFPMQTLQMAKMEATNGIFGTYYFRIVPSVFKPDIIKAVVDYGHEVGFHYEELSASKGNSKKAIVHFERNLERIRKFYPVKTICAHGSPLSLWNNKEIWQEYDYKNFGIIADTAYDIDYDKVFYISDNGRSWNRESVSIRDKVESKFHIPLKSTKYLIEIIQSNKLPNQVMINAHPDTFFDYGLKYFLNWLFIESKNIAKWGIVKSNLIK